MTVPANSPYSGLMIGYFGNLDAAAQTALWQAFKQKNGYTTDPANTDVAALVKFGDYVQQVYSDDALTPELSPEEIHRRQLLFSLYDLIVTMMKTIQDTIGVQGEDVVFLNKYQKEYTDMMKRQADAFYQSGALSTATINTQDLTKWKLGYGNITMDEYITASVAGTLDPNDHQTLLRPQLVLHSDFDTANNNLQNTLTFDSTDSSITFTLTLNLPTNINFPVLPLSQTITFDPLASFADKLDAARQGFLDFYSAVGNALLTPQFHIYYGLVTDQSLIITTPTVIGSSEGDEARQAAAASSRETKNSLLNQFIENARSRREILANQAGAQQSNQEGGKQGISTAANILQATIKQLNTILDSIFKR